MGRKAHKMLQDAMSAFAAEDEAAAKAVIDADDAVDYDFNTIKRMPLTMPFVNIAEWVEFLRTGRYHHEKMF